VRNKIIAAAALIIVVALTGAANANADSIDEAYLAALHHGGLCCQNQPDTPIPYPSAEAAVRVGKGIAVRMSRSTDPAYTFGWIQDDNNRRLGLNSFDAGEIIVVALHFYAPATECALIKGMGGSHGSANYWYGPSDYRGNMVVAPNCDLTR